MQILAERLAEPSARGRDDVGRRFVAFSFCRADILIEVDDQQRIVFAAGTMRATLGKKSQELIGRPLAEIIHDEDRRLVGDLLRANAADARVNDVAVRLISGQQVASEAALSGYRVPDFDNHFFVALKVKPRPPAPPQRRAGERDDETGILGRQSFAAAAAERIHSAQEAGLKPQMTMVKIANLEQMKAELGADQQRQVLGKIGDILKGKSIGGDAAGRLDDNNFAFVHGKEVNVAEVTRDIEAAATEAGAPEFALETETATVAADAPLSDDQMAKAIVYSMHQFCDKGAAAAAGNMSEMLERRMAETMKQVSRFRRICQTRDFDLAYMPICELKTRKVHHVEALARFRTPGDGGSPYKLIAMAEEMEIITHFDLAVAIKTVEVLKRGGATGRIPPIAINVSGHSIGDAAFVEQLHDILGRAINLRDLISIEITESSKIENLENVNRSIQVFRQKGFKVALDDFGAGAAGFDYLNTLDVDAVKFDGPVVKRAFATEKGKAFLASMATLCNQTGIETVAEMVETEELAKFLAGIGVHLGQGYYFAKPSINIDSFPPGSVLALEKQGARAT